MAEDEEPYFQAISHENSHANQPDAEVIPESFSKRFIFILVFSILAIITVLAILVAGVAHNILSPNSSELSEPNGTLSAKATISVYYEVLCADSKAFIVNQLVPVQKKYREHINVRFVPFGKASFIKRDNNQYQFYCQHGEEECHGNKLHACLIEAYDNNDDQSKLASVIACSLNKYQSWDATINSITRKTEECRREFFPDDDMQPFLCPNATELLVKYGNETLGLKPPLTFVPTVAVDGSLSFQNTKLSDLDNVVCQAVKKRTSINC